MTDATRLDFLEELFGSHGLRTRVENDWILPERSEAPLRTLWFPSESGRGGQLDVHVALGDERTIVESFGGVGAGEAGERDALQNFMINSFHVLMSALWSRGVEEQVQAERWTIGEVEFRVLIGNLGVRSAGEVALDLPKELFETVEAAIRRETFDECVHWVRTFTGVFDERCIFEALVDNEEWPAGCDALASLTWPRPGVFYSVRNFLMLVPV
ncbi:MAG: hypothetical protein H6834_10375 [Planctomycetes bacterium]|nr:hypothetical protein [Planctomycetota bacterium]